MSRAPSRRAVSMKARWSSGSARYQRPSPAGLLWAQSASSSRDRRVSRMATYPSSLRLAPVTTAASSLSARPSSITPHSPPRSRIQSAESDGSTTTGRSAISSIGGDQLIERLIDTDSLLGHLLDPPLFHQQILGKPAGSLGKEFGCGEGGVPSDSALQQ